MVSAFSPSDISFSLASAKRNRGDQLVAEKNYAEAKGAYLEALRAMGHSTRVHSSAPRQLINTVYQGLIQHTHRYQYGVALDRTLVCLRHGDHGAAELAHVYFQIAKIQGHVDGDSWASVTSLLLALNYAESSLTVEPSLLGEIYTTMASAICTLFPWGTTIFLGAPGGYYRARALQVVASQSRPEDARRVTKAIHGVDDNPIPFAPLPFVFVAMLCIAAYEILTGRRIISLLLTGHTIFECSLAAYQFFLARHLPDLRNLLHRA